MFPPRDKINVIATFSQFWLFPPHNFEFISHNSAFFQSEKSEFQNIGLNLELWDKVAILIKENPIIVFFKKMGWDAVFNFYSAATVRCKLRILKKGPNSEFISHNSAFFPQIWLFSVRKVRIARYKLDENTQLYTIAIFYPVAGMLKCCVNCSPGTLKLMTSLSSPLSWAFFASMWDRRANSSCSKRDTPNAAARRSAECPIVSAVENSATAGS